MKRSTYSSRKSPNLPVAWRETEYAAARTRSAETFDDRVSDDIFDIEDERAEVDMIVHRMAHDAS